MDDARDGVIKRLERALEEQKHVNDVLARQVDDLMFYQRLGDIAEIEIVSFTGPPPRNTPNPTAQGRATRSSCARTSSSRATSIGRRSIR